jgi:hypothetical protein
MQPTSPTRALADHLLDGKLDEFVLGQRAAGIAWRKIAIELLERTGVDVTEQTLRNWYATDPRAAAS